MPGYRDGVKSPTLGVTALLILGLALAGCATARPGTGGSSSAPAATASSAAPSTPAAPPTSASPSPSASTSPTAAAVVLAGDGLGGFTFGTPQKTVAALLTDHLGKPSSSSQGLYCELDSSSPWTETVMYKNLWVQYEAKDSKKTSARTLQGWGYQIKGTLPSALAIIDDVPLDLSFKQLKAKYPGTKTLDLGLEDGTVALQLPNDLIFYGIKVPEVVRGGKIGVCE
jgi:hypothetical protein